MEKPDDVIKWKNFPRYWPFVRGIHRSPVNSPHKGQWRGALMFSLTCAWMNGWVNNHEAGDLRRHRAHYDVREMKDEQKSSGTICCVYVNALIWSFVFLSLLSNRWSIKKICPWTSETLEGDHVIIGLKRYCFKEGILLPSYDIKRKLKLTTYSMKFLLLVWFTSCQINISYFNKANLRDLIAATGLVILLKLDLNRRFFSPCDLEIWWMTPKKQ